MTGLIWGHTSLSLPQRPRKEDRLHTQEAKLKCTIHTDREEMRVEAGDNCEVMCE